MPLDYMRARSRGFDVWTAMFKWWGGSDPTDANTLYYDEWSAGSPSEFRLFPGFPLVLGLFFFFARPSQPRSPRRAGPEHRSERTGRLPSLNTLTRGTAVDVTRYLFFIFYFFLRVAILCVHVNCQCCARYRLT